MKPLYGALIIGIVIPFFVVPILIWAMGMSPEVSYQVGKTGYFAVFWGAAIMYYFMMREKEKQQNLSP